MKPKNRLPSGDTWRRRIAAMIVAAKAGVVADFALAAAAHYPELYRPVIEDADWRDPTKAAPAHRPAGEKDAARRLPSPAKLAD